MFSFFRKKAPSPAATAAPPAGALIGSALVAPIEVPEAAPAAVERERWIDKLKSGLRKTGSSISAVFSGAKIDDELYEELESALLMADTGVKATQQLLDDVKRRVRETGADHPVQVRNLLIEALTQLLKPLEKTLVIGEHKPTVVMVAGVNGAGKTTSIGKLAKWLQQQNLTVLLAAGDTFRAAAREHLPGGLRGGVRPHTPRRLRLPRSPLPGRVHLVHRGRHLGTRAASAEATQCPLWSVPGFGMISSFGYAVT